VKFFASLTVSLLVLAALAFGQQPRAIFVDQTQDTGLEFTHINGAAGELLLPEVIGSGGAVLDYDNDGDLDVFVVQGSTLRPGASGSAHGLSATSRLYRNDRGVNGDMRVRFTDVTERSGLVTAGYGMGAATGDFDNDGWADLYVTFLGSSRLFRNGGDGTFIDVTARTRTDVPAWATSATFFDYDRDGWLDLFVATYVDFSVDMKRGCFSAGSARDYCNPVVYAPVADRLFHNEGNGTFTDVSARAGISRSPARSLGVLAADYNDDGWLDLYVANDGDPNQLWINQRGAGTFKDEALLAGVAVNRNGQAQGSMGIDLGDIDGDEDEDLFVTNLDNEGNTLYLNLGKGLYEDRTTENGLFKLGFTGFGTRFVDYDLDGWLDLFIANGAVRHLSRQALAGDSYPLKQRSQVYRNDRKGKFTDVTERAGSALAPLLVSRGVAAGDLDNDGATDLVVFNNSGPARVLMNDARPRGHWLGVRVIDSKYRRDALQARVELVRRGRGAVKRVQADGSYCTSGDPRVVFGLDQDQATQTVRVHWGPGDVEEFRNLTADRYWRLERGKPAAAM
jgi:enediyne biosynthesis protein E4